MTKREYVKNKVNQLKKKYGTNDLDEIAHQKDIEIIICPLNDIWGMYKYINKNKVIFINSKLDVKVQRFVLAHELGHAILHPKASCFFINETNYISKIKTEYEANLFAAEFLIDENKLTDSLFFNYSIDQIASLFEVPIELIKYKFNYD